MKERFCPQPENPKQKAPEAGAGPLGLPPPPGPEQSPQDGGSRNPEHQPLLEHGEGQGEPADLNVSSSANTGDSESPEAGLKDKFPIKKRRWRSSSVGGGRLHGYGEDECPRAPEDRSP